MSEPVSISCPACDSPVPDQGACVQCGAHVEALRLVVASRRLYSASLGDAADGKSGASEASRARFRLSLPATLCGGVIAGWAIASLVPLPGPGGTGNDTGQLVAVGANPGASQGSRISDGGPGRSSDAGTYSRSGLRLRDLWSGLRHARPTPVHVIRRGDTLSALAGHYLGDSEAYPRLLAINPGLVAKALPIGLHVRLPVKAAREVPETAWFEFQAEALERLVGDDWRIVDLPDGRVAESPAKGRPDDEAIYFARAGEERPRARLSLVPPYELASLSRGESTP